MARPVVRRTLLVALLALPLAALPWLPIPVCPTAALFHFPCPGCGMTRATMAALHGNFAESFRLHPLAMVVVPALAAYVAAHAVSYIRHGESRVDQVLAGKLFDRLMLAVLALVLLVWVARFFGAFGGPAPV